MADRMSMAASGKEEAQLTSINPATGAVVGKVPVTSDFDIPVVVARAREAQLTWGGLTHQERADAILPVADKLRRDADQLGRLIVAEMGKPLKDGTAEAMGQAARLPAKLDEIVDALQPESVEDENTLSVIYREPFGVAAAITPWNFPLYEPLDMMVPALVAGNAVILKPSDATPLLGERIAAMLNETLPRDVLQVVQGGDDCGKALVAADGVDLIVFTGSQAAGKHILSAASQSLKRVILELGGKDPLVILDDADIEVAARYAVYNSFRVAGQVCVSTERIYVDRKIADAFEQRVVALAAELKVGDGIEDGVDLGPMTTAHQKSWVLSRIQSAVRQGAKVLLDGRKGNDPDDQFLRPTVLANISNDMEIMREETFGPVACIVRFETVEDAINLANDTRYGLGAAVFGKDEKRAREVGRRLQAGMVGVNKSCHGARGTPWVGAKQSGYGWHSGRDGHRQFAQPKVLSVSKDN